MKKFRTALCAAVFVLSALPAIAASIDPRELEALVADAQRNGAVPVVVNIGSASFKQLEADGTSKKTILEMERRARVLMRELGAEALDAGRWESKLGQMGLLITSVGLDVLVKTSNAISFYRGSSRVLDALSAKPAFRALQSQLAQGGTVGAVVRVRNEAAEHDLGRDGSVLVHGDKAAVAEHVARANRILASLPQIAAAKVASAHKVLEAQSTQLSLTSSSIIVDVDKRALIELAHHADVRTIEPIEYADTSSPFRDEAALRQAMRLGNAEVLLFLRDPLPKVGLSATESRQMKAANSRALLSVLHNHGINAAVTDIAEFGVVATTASLAELQRLYASADRRILGVELNKPVAQPALATSTVEMNLPPWWNADAPAFPNAGYQGAYPSVLGSPASPAVPVNVIVFDTGVQRTHPMLANKVVYEACFGSNVDFVNQQGQIVQQFRSICPQQGANNTPEAGDSPLTNILNSAAPSPLGIDCVINTAANPTASDVCSHGTHVAGIAAGNNGAGRRGVAPQANIVAIQVFSFDPARTSAPNAFTVDIFRGLQAAANAMTPVPTPVTPSSPRNNYVINMSIGGQVFNAPCNDRTAAAPGTALTGHPTLGALMDAVAQLKDRGVPVVASSGNNSSTTGIAFPGCLPGVIKVGAMQNTPAGNQQTWYSNYPVLASFPGETYLVAPGGAGVTGLPGIESAWIAPGEQYHQLSGTSQAAPHVAGLYAMVMAGYRKLNLAFTVEAATAFIQGTDGSFDVTVAVPGGSRVYRAVRLRNP